jgi:flagellar biosynthesis/type III secretory pathway chaperone
MEQDPALMTNTLEDLLVREFRACQTLLNLTKDERQALAKNDVQALSALVEQKEAWLDELGQVEDQRRMLVQEIARQIAGRLPLISPSPSVAELAAALEPEVGERVNRLRDGISALSGEIRQLSSGNRALAASALERTDAVQTLILDFLRPSLNYQPPGAPHRLENGAAWGVDQRT